MTAIKVFLFLMVPVCVVLVLVLGRQFGLRPIRRLHKTLVRRLRKGSLAFGLAGATMSIITPIHELALAGAAIVVAGVWFGSYLFPKPDEE